MLELLWLLPTIFWMWMIYDCVRNDPEKNTWLWILIFLNVPGAVIYFLVRRLPLIDLPIPNYFNRWTRRREVWNAEAAAMNIGKAHQFVLLGNLLFELELFHRAADAYNTALEKEPNNIQALWGAASIDTKNQNFESAKRHLEKLLELEPESKYGEASLLYIKTLLSLQERDAARVQLEENIKSWAKPEAYLMMAEIQAEQGNIQEARSHLEIMLRKLRGSPQFHYRRNQHLVRKANKLLRTLR
ncbi:MAG: tetratricopeptide repeat protein [Xenococcaceae cyanobacterium]